MILIPKAALTCSCCSWPPRCLSWYPAWCGSLISAAWVKAPWETAPSQASSCKHKEKTKHTQTVFTPEKEIWMSGWDGNWAAESNWNKCSAFKHVQSRCGEHSHTRGSKGFLYENKLKIICDLLTCTLQRGRSGLRWVDLQPERARSLLHTPHPLQQWTGREKKKHLRKTLHVFSIAEGFNGLIILLLQ